MRWSRSIRNVLIAATLVLTLSGCAGRGSGVVPPPELEYGWSPTMKMEIDAERMPVRCLTVNDKRKLDIYIEFMKATEEVLR